MPSEGRLECSGEGGADMTMTRPDLEQAIIDRMPLRPCDVPVIQDALQTRTDVQLEDLLKRMKEVGR